METEGYRRLALVVGVGEYRNENLDDLKGPPNDALLIYNLLIHKYEFLPENVCLLLNEDATYARSKEIFEKALINRAKEKDIAVFYFAGHGSQTLDLNNDEEDGWDETFILHDSRTKRIPDLVDDEFNAMLGRLYKKTINVIVILDSCNSGTATRGREAGTFIARFQPAAEKGVASRATRGKGDAIDVWVPESMPGLILFTAATDGTSAVERNGEGVFTGALYQVLARAGKEPLTYAQVARQVPPLVSAASYQIPFFHGNLDREVFGYEGRTRPISWEVKKTAPHIELSGLPMPGIGLGSEMRIYDGAANRVDTQDPGKAKATVVIDRITGLNAIAHIIAARPNAKKPVEGDLAILIRPSDINLKISVRLRPEEEPGGIPRIRADALKRAINSNQEAQMVTELTDGPGDFELSVDHEGRLQLRGPENNIRKTYDKDDQVSKNLWQHARQKALRQLKGEGGSEFVDNETLEIQLVPALKKDSAANLDKWKQQLPNTEQIIPEGMKWNIKVKLSDKSPKPLLVGGVVFSTDGCSFGFPFDGRAIRLSPGEEYIFRGKGETYVGSAPFDIQDSVMVFGTQETNPVPWYLLTSTADERTALKGIQGSLYIALGRYLTPGTRGQQQTVNTVEDTTWTVSALTMKVKASQR